MIRQEFFENVALLLLTATITGLLAPYLLKIIEDRRLRARAKFEDDLARQAKVIDAQVDLLEAFADAVWQFQLMAIEVTYYHGKLPDELYERALEKYQQEVGKLLVKIRSLISKSTRLVPHDAYLRLSRLYYAEFLPLDSRLQILATAKVEGQDDNAAWHRLNQYAVFALAEKVDNEIRFLAQSLNLEFDSAGPADRTLTDDQPAR